MRSCTITPLLTGLCGLEDKDKQTCCDLVRSDAKNVELNYARPPMSAEGRETTVDDS